LNGDIVAFVLTSDGTTLVRTVAPSQIDAAIDAVNLAFRVPDRLAQDRTLTRAYELLFQPLRSILPARGTLVFVLDDEYSDIPFSALRDRSGRYVVEDFSVAISSTVKAAIVYLRRPEQRRLPGRAVIIGDPAFDSESFPHYRRLPAAAAEATQIARLYPASVLLLNRAATKENVVKEMANADVLHFAGHAVLDVGRGRGSFLLCAPGIADRSGALHAGEILNAKRHFPSLVVLAGCQSLTGRAAGRASRNSISEMFLSAGVLAVVGTTTDVADSSSAPLLADFHKQYLRTGNSALALRETQIATIRGNSTRPAQWGVFRIEI